MLAAEVPLAARSCRSASILTSLPAVLASLFVGGFAQAAEAHRALMLGNSYTQFNELDQRVEELARGSGPPLVAIDGERLADGGLTLNDHFTRASTTSSPWYARFGEGSVPARFLVLQDQSQVPGFPEDHPFWITSAAAVGPLADMGAAAGATPFLFVTWGRRDGDSGNPTLYPDFTTMNTRLEQGYRRYAELAATIERPIYLVPVNRAFAHIHDQIVAAGADPLADGSEFVALYDGDGSHPSRQGSALIAAVMVPALTGWSPRWLSPPPDLDREEVEPLIDVAEAVVVPDGDLAWPWAGPWLSDEEDGAPPAAGRLISHPVYLWTEVLPGGETMVADLALGGAHEDGDGWTGGGGRLWVPSGATVTLDRVALGQAEGGAGELVINGGVAIVGELHVQAARGRVRVRAGEAHLDQLLIEESAVDGVFLQSLELDGGTLSVNAADDLLQRGGTLRSGGATSTFDRLEVRGGAVQADPGARTAEAALLVGTGVWTVIAPDGVGCAPDMPELSVVWATACDVGGLSLDASPGCVAEVRSTGDGTCGVFLRGDGPVDPGGDDTSAPEPTDTGDEEIDAPAEDSGEDGLSIVKTPDSGCGCAGGGAPLSAVGAAIAALVIRRRRRA
jgi:uncharacterized protein (TIGR03382 family)